jgi:hypothetical protein
MTSGKLAFQPLGGQIAVAEESPCDGESLEPAELRSKLPDAGPIEFKPGAQAAGEHDGVRQLSPRRPVELDRNRGLSGLP